jgi:hypothetical protein
MCQACITNNSWKRNQLIYQFWETYQIVCSMFSLKIENKSCVVMSLLAVMTACVFMFVVGCALGILTGPMKGAQNAWHREQVCTTSTIVRQKRINEQLDGEYPTL